MSKPAHSAPLIKSKERVAQHGEVMTPEHIVNDMLDLVKQETERIESRFLEPACGTGNFLIEILRRKLDVVDARYRKSQYEWERAAVTAVSALYGIELLPDNVDECRSRLFAFFEGRYAERFKKKIKPDCLESARYVLRKNIIWGDALTLKTADGKDQ
ncbi:MAG: SAM-dependent DNA methyltransferase, partial [Armatimonadetes bacterium]